MADNTGTAFADSTKKFLTDKVGPLPLWAWFGVVIATVVAVRLYNARRSGSDTTYDPNSDNSTQDVTQPTVPPGVGYIPNTPDGTDPIQDTNAQWKVRAINAVQNKYGGFAATNALGAYLAGNALGPEQVVIVNEAVRLVGAPPEGAPVQPGTPVITPPKARSKASTLRMEARSNPKKVGDKFTVEYYWIDSATGKGLSGSLYLQTLKGKIWVILGPVPVKNGVGTHTATLTAASAKTGSWRVVVPATNTVYQSTASNAIPWQIR